MHCSLSGGLLLASNAQSLENIQYIDITHDTHTILFFFEMLAYIADIKKMKICSRAKLVN